jgi:hypothetical protein
MTIYDIKYRTQETNPYFFSTKTLKFFGQTLKSFRVYKQKSGKFLITASGRYGLITKRLFNPINNELELIQEVI